MLTIPFPPGVEQKMLKADFWLERSGVFPDLLLADPKRIKSLEKMTAKRMKALHLEGEFTPFLAMRRERRAEEVKELMASFSLPDAMPSGEIYNRDGSLRSEHWRENLILESNLSSLPEKVEGASALTTKRTSIRAFPTRDSAVRSKETNDVDLFQLTALSIGSPAIIWHRSSSGDWSYIQSEIYSGWAKSRDLAIGEREEIIEFCQKEPRLVVTGSRVETEPNPFMEEIGGLLLQQGDSLPLLKEEEIPSEIPKGSLHGQAPFFCYVAQAPLRDSKGWLQFSPSLIPISAPVKIGFKPLTRRSLVEAAFASLGERYGWGGSFGRRDCSRLVFDIYRLAGLTIPRDAGLPQEKGAAGETISFHGHREERLKQLDQLLPGDALYLKGHVMIYLGRAKRSDTGEMGHYVIHAGAGYGLLEDGAIRPVTAHSTFIMELGSYLMGEKKTFLEALTVARKFYQEEGGI